MKTIQRYYASSLLKDLQFDTLDILWKCSNTLNQFREFANNQQPQLKDNHNYSIFLKQIRSPSRSYIFEVNNRNTRTRCEICLKLPIKTPERRH